jgi:hypothetical protein
MAIDYVGRTGCTVALLAIVAATARCGGRVLDQGAGPAAAAQGDGEPPQAAGDDSGTTAPADGATDVAVVAPDCAVVRQELTQLVSDVIDGGDGPHHDGADFFDAQADMVGFFTVWARKYGLVDPAHGLDCTPSGVHMGECAYDPRLLRWNGSDVHYSNAAHEFLGPDDQPYDWAYVPEWNVWVLGRAMESQKTYDLVRAYAACGD